MTTEVIVYRNPGEQAFWNLMMSGEALPLILGVIAAFAVFYFYAIKTEKLSRRFTRNQVDVMNWVAVFVSIFVGYQVWAFLFSRIS